MTQHRCTIGTWQNGKTSHCAACKAAGTARPVKVKRRTES